MSAVMQARMARAQQLQELMRELCAWRQQPARPAAVQVLCMLEGGCWLV
jgi:hypothetical protein